MRSRHCSARTVQSGESRASRTIVLETRLSAGSAVQSTLSSGVARREKTRYRPVPLEMRCRCSADRVETMLKSFPRDEIADLKVDDNVVVTCEFCGHDYIYSDDDIDTLYNG